MKKLYRALLVTFAISSTALAQTSFVSNVFGYTQETFTENQIKIVSPQFLTTQTNGIALGDAFATVPNATIAYTWNGAVYAAYTYYTGYGWFDSAYASSDGIIIELGDALWLQIPSDEDILISGTVPNADSITNNLVIGINLIANPYPTPLTIGDIPLSSLSNEDIIYVWDGSTYSMYTYYAGYGWYNSAFAISDDAVIPVGQGFWLQSAAGGPLVLNKQY